MEINDVTIEDTFAEASYLYMGRVIVTAETRRWAKVATEEAKGLGTSTTMKPKAPGEAGIEGKINSPETPDERPGYILLCGEPSREELFYYLISRIRKGVLTAPTTSAFDYMPEKIKTDDVEVEGTPIHLFGDGYEEIVNKFDRSLYKIPRMGGFFYIDIKLGVAKGIGGGNFLILAGSQGSGLLASEAAGNAIDEIPYTFTVGPYGGGPGPASSGTKVGGEKYKDAVATTNHLYCPCIADKVEDTRVPDDVECIYEICIDGLTLDAVKDAMGVGIEAATKEPGVKKITAANYGGKLGDEKIYLKDIL